MAATQFTASTRIFALPVALIIQQNRCYPNDVQVEQQQALQQHKNNQQKAQQHKLMCCMEDFLSSQCALFDVRVFNPLAPSNRYLFLTQCFCCHEQEKRRAHEQRVRETEQGSFTPLVFAAMGGMGIATTSTYKRIASLIATKQDQLYSQVISWMHCVLSFSLLRSAIMCLRGGRTLFQARPVCSVIELAMSESRVHQ